jgi:outer membrane protein assembly factor BamB
VSLLVATAFWSLLSVPAQSPPGKLVASKEPGWPQWRGPRRDGISDEKGLLQAWPERGPALLWKVEGLGRGWSSPIVTRGAIYITGDVGEELSIFAFDLEGKPRWKAANGRAWTREYPGARASLVYDEGSLYHMNAHGRVARLDAATGRETWSVDAAGRFEASVITWGLSECLVVDGTRLIVTPGGKKGAIAALDRKTGETVWASEPIPGNNAGYGSPILFELGGRRHIVNCSSRHVFGVDAETGRGLWKRIRPSEYQALCFTPVLVGDGVYVTTPGKNGGTLYRIGAEEREPRIDTVWDTPLDTLQGGTVLVGGLLYGSGYMGFKGWAALDVATGQPRHTTRELASGAVVFADGRLYCLSEQGEMALLKPAPAAFEVAGRFPLTALRKQDVWAHPVVCDGRLYLRYHDTLYCYDLRSK